MGPHIGSFSFHPQSLVDKVKKKFGRAPVWEKLEKNFGRKNCASV
jgi:hypothetical protein